MNKATVLIVFLIIGNISYSQKQNKDCSINHKCYLTVSVDGFEDFKSSTINKKTVLNSKLRLKYYLSRYEKNNIDRTTLTFIQETEQCRTKKSYANIMLDNGEKIKLYNMFKDIDCGTGYMTVDVTDYLTELKSYSIKKIRINLDYPIDYDIKNEDYLSFLNNLICINK